MVKINENIFFMSLNKFKKIYIKVFLICIYFILKCGIDLLEINIKIFVFIVLKLCRISKWGRDKIRVSGTFLVFRVFCSKLVFFYMIFINLEYFNFKIDKDWNFIMSLLFKWN